MSKQGEPTDHWLTTYVRVVT